MSRAPVDLGEFLADDGRRKLCSWYEDSDTGMGWLVLDGPGGTETLGLIDLTTAHIVTDGIETVAELRRRVLP